MTTIASIHRTVAARQRARAHRSIPRQPSARNLEIYNRVIANCEPQHLLAAEFNLHPSRISQILRNVRAYIQARSASEGRAASNPNNATTSPNDSPSPTPTASPFLLRLSTLITREEHLHTLFMREYSRHASPPTESSATDAPTSDPQPLSSASVQCLKAAHRTLLELHRLYQLEHNLLNPPQSPTTPTRRASEDNHVSHPNNASASDASLSSLQDALFLLRQQAEDDGLVPKSDNLYLLVKNILHSFVGQPQGTYGGGFLHLDDSIRQFLKTFLISPLPVTHPQPRTRPTPLRTIRFRRPGGT